MVPALLDLAIIAKNELERNGLFLVIASTITPFSYK